MPKRKRRRRSSGRKRGDPNSDLALLGGVGAFFGAGQAAHTASLIGIGVGATGVALPAAASVGLLAGSGYAINRGLRGKRIKKRGGSRKGHPFFGNQYRKIAKYARRKGQSLRNRFGRGRRRRGGRGR